MGTKAIGTTDKFVEGKRKSRYIRVTRSGKGVTLKRFNGLRHAQDIDDFEIPKEAISRMINLLMQAEKTFSS